MPNYPCLVLDHDDTVVQSETTVNYPFFRDILHRFRPHASITPEQYTLDCFRLGFAEMCRQRFGFSEQELEAEFQAWLCYVRTHIPPPYAGIARILSRQKEAGGLICVVSHSAAENILRDYRTHFGIEPDAVFSWDLPEPLRKPSTYALDVIMRRYSLTPAQLLVVDDMKSGFDMAHQAGVPVAFAAWGRRDCPEICAQMRALCDFSFDSPAQLEQFLFEPLDNRAIMKEEISVGG